MGFPGGSDGKKSAAVQETWVQPLSWEDPLEKGMATQLQYSCMENSMDRGACWATVHGVSKSWTGRVTNTLTSLLYCPCLTSPRISLL